MKESIDLKRMSLWANKFWFETRKPFFLYLLVIAGFLFVWESIFLAFQNPNLFSERTQLAQYIVLLFVSGCLSANFLFADVREKSKSIVFLMTPASALEKIIVTIFFGVPVFFVGYNLAYYAVDWPMVHMANKQNASQYGLFNIFKIGEFENPFINESNSIYLLYVYFAIQSCFILGAIYFKKFSLLKTSIVMFGIWVMYIVLQTVVAGLLPVGDFSALSASYRVVDLDGIRTIELPSWLTVFGGMFLKFLIVPLLWVAIFFRLREKQVA